MRDEYFVEAFTRIGELPVKVNGKVEFYEDSEPYVEIETVIFDGNRLIPEILVPKTEEKLKEALLDEALDDRQEEIHQEQVRASKWRY